MSSNDRILHAALASLLAFGLSQPAAAEEAKGGEKEKCYGIAKAGQNDCGTVRLSAGYMYSIWYNVTRTNEWINAVQHNNFVDQSDNFNSFLAVDGFVTRLERRG